MPFKPLDRRTFLRAAGVSVALPFLEGMAPAVDAPAPPRRMVLIGRPLGMHTPFLFPERAGRDYEHSRYTRLLDAHRRDFTVISGMSHRGYTAGHHTDVALMTGAPAEGVRVHEVHNTISLDQEVASRIGQHTRFGSLVLGGGAAAWNRRGVRIPPTQRPSFAFRMMFIQGTPEEQAREIRRLQDGRSILDDLRSETRTLSDNLGAADRQRLDLFLTSIREAEQRLQQDEAWVNRPKPRVTAQQPVDATGAGTLLERSRQWYDIVHLALQTDSTRVISLWLSSQERPTIDGVTLTHHDASHHGQDPSKIDQLATIEEAEMRLFAGFLTKLKDTREGEATLLDRTIIFLASNLGNASGHTVDNLPIILAGGGFRHQGHVAYDRRNNTPLSNLFLRMLQQLGIEMRSFGSSTVAINEV